MKKTVFLVMINLYGALFSQVVGRFEYHAVCIPATNTENISIDGNLKEWEWVPEKYKILNNNLINSEKVSANDIEIECFVAWSGKTNKIYVIAKVNDDIINLDKLNEDDGIDILVSPNMLTGQFWSGSHYKLYYNPLFYFFAAANKKPGDIKLYYGPHWMINKDYVNFATTMQQNENNTTTTYYEFELSLWEYMSLYTTKLSKPFVLKPEMQIGLVLNFNDVDKNIFERDIYLSTICSDSHHFVGDESSIFILDQPNGNLNLYDQLILLNMN